MFLLIKRSFRLKMDIQKLVESMSIEQLCSQVIVGTLSNSLDEDAIYRRIEKERPGSLYFDVLGVDVSQAELDKKLKRDKYWSNYTTDLLGIPCLTTTDLEYGPVSYCKGLPQMPRPMAWGACNDEKMIERAGELTARICRKLGVHHTLAPVVDLNLNFQNPVTGYRAVSDDADRVIKIAGAYMRGLQKNGYMATCLKHFPGDGVDDRNQHFMTTVNSLSKEEWMASYGKVYKELFKQGAPSVMVGHISCPAFQEGEITEYGALPGSLSKKLITDLLKGELGFKGCVISDAMSMIGVGALLPMSRVGIEFFKAGGDLMLFPEAGEYERLVAAVKSGDISIERLRDAAMRVLKLKQTVRLFEQTDIEEEIGDITGDCEELDKLSQQIADNAVKIMRNNLKVVPVQKEKGRVLLINVVGHYGRDVKGTEFNAMADEFQKYGWEVESTYNPKHRWLEENMEKFDVIVMNTHPEMHGASMRMGWKYIMPLWRGLVLHHPNFIIVAYDDPYRLYDFPYAKTLINTFSDQECAQRAATKVILGKIEAKGKCPVSLKGFFERED